MEAVVEFVAPWCLVDDLVWLFLTSKSVGKVMEIKDFIDSLYHRMSSFLNPNDVVISFPSLIRCIDRCYITLRTRKYFPNTDLYFYLFRCVTRGRVDIAEKTVSFSDLDRLENSSQMYSLLGVAVKQDEFDSISYLIKVFGNSGILWTLEVIAEKNNLSLFRKVYEQCTTINDRISFKSNCGSVIDHFCGHKNTQAINYILHVANTDGTKAKVLCSAVNYHWEECVEVVKHNLTTITGCRALANAMTSYNEEVQKLIKKWIEGMMPPGVVTPVPAPATPLNVRIYTGRGVDGAAYWEENNKFVIVERKHEGASYATVIGIADTIDGDVVRHLSDEQVSTARNIGLYVQLPQ